MGLLVVLACMFLGQNLAALVLFPLLGVPPTAAVADEMGIAAQLAVLLTGLGTVLLLALWLWFKEKRPFGSLGFFPAPRVGGPIALGSVVALVALSLPILVNLLSGQYVVESFTISAAVLLALAGFAVQASTEEILTRGYLLQVTYRRWGVSLAIAVQTVVFTALHGANLNVSAVALLNILLIGALLGFWALAEGGLWGVCAFHTVWNWCQGNIYGIEVSGMGFEATWWDMGTMPGGADVLTGGGFGVEGSVLTTVVLVAMTAISFLAWRRTSRLRTETAAT